MRTIYFLRHGESELNVWLEEQTTKQLDEVPDFEIPDFEVQLTEKGRGEVYTTAEEYKDVKFDFVYVSPYKRAIQTFEYFKEVSTTLENIKILIDDRIREYDMGSMYYHNIAKAANLYGPDLHSHRLKVEYDFSLFGGDSHVSIKERVKSILNEVRGLPDGSHILMVSHAGFFRAMVNELTQHIAPDICMIATIKNARIQRFIV